MKSERQLEGRWAWLYLEAASSKIMLWDVTDTSPLWLYANRCRRFHVNEKADAKKKMLDFS
jgi:hypothetical protein